ncbi:MAG: acetolactate synthase large subunit [Chloroflexi bacterium]|nr:acetolactate synthase large subunit [Chloroflexota bacterium]
MKASDLLVKCLENEGVEYIFGVPGEEVLDLMDSLSRSRIRFVLTRHEQGAAFMANIYGRLTGRAGVCLSTLGPGATNLLTGVADATLDRSPVVAITGQTALARRHKESHQYVDIVRVFRPVTKWNARVERPEVIPELVRKAFRIAEAEKPGATHLELPEDMAQMEALAAPLEVRPIEYPNPSPNSIQQASAIIEAARQPIIIAGNGVIRRRAERQLVQLAHKLEIPVTYTFMGKGCIDYSDPACLMAVGLQSRDWVMCGLERADVVIAVGYDLVEYSPSSWNPARDKRIIHIDTTPSEVDRHYLPEVEVVAELGQALEALARACPARKQFLGHAILREVIMAELGEHSDGNMPLKPQKMVADLRLALENDDILISDVGAHKLWIARMFPAIKPNTVIISNGFASMGLGVPGAIAAKLAHPERRVVAVCGDGGFMMTSQELETARRLGLSFVVVIWVDGGYGMIEWKQLSRFGTSYGVKFGNPDFVQYARSFGLPGFRIDSPEQLLPTLKHALDLELPSIIELPIDYRENLKLTEKLGHLICPI